MKAWVVNIKDNFDATVVFAETRGKAKSLAQYTDACDGAEYCDIEVRRLPEADKYYKEGKTEMGWDNMQDRLTLVKEFGFSCEYADLDKCETCTAREYCGAYEEYTDAYAGEDSE